MNNREAIQELIEMETEYRRARTLFGPFASAHEGYAVLKEEVDELWDAVKAGDMVQVRKEAVQVGAMALAFLMEMEAEDVG